MNNFNEIVNFSNYQFNPYAIPNVLVASLVLILGLFVYYQEKESTFNRSFLYLCFSVFLWLYGYAIAFSCIKESIAIFWVRLLYVGIILIPVNIFHISISYTKRYIQEKGFIITGYLVALFFIFLIRNKYFISGVDKYFWGFYAQAGLLQCSFLGFSLFFTSLGLLNLINHFRSNKDAIERKRAVLLMAAFMFTYIGNIDVLPSYGIEIYPIGYLNMLCFVLIITYSIIKLHTLRIDQYAQELQTQVNIKTQELTKALRELKNTQLKLVESGKISALASLSAGILHQISQPLTAIHGFVRFLSKEMKEDDPFYKPVRLIEEQSIYLKEMLEDLMELIRHREIKKSNIDINAPLKRAVELLDDELRIRRIQWTLDLADNLSLVYGDPIHLQQVFMNIIVNAIDAMSSLPREAPRELKIVSIDNKLEKVNEIKFQDTGVGMSEEIRLQIFEPFFSTKTDGVGMGLALCKDVIYEHKGFIDLQSSLGGGTTFTIKLPYAES